MGVVYSAHDLSLEREVALKELVFPAGLTHAVREEMLLRFSREARAAARLSHPNVVQVFDVFDEGDRHFIAMELLSGENLGAVLARCRLPIETSVAVLVQVLDALQAAHEVGVVHRDIKPDNVFLLDDGRVKVADFGIARVMDGSAATLQTQFGTVLGTPGYMSPEQVMGLEVDGRSDVFAVGAVGYEMLTGNCPFAAPSTGAVLYRVANENPAPLAAQGIPPGIAATIMRALEKHPESRYQSAAEMARDLRTGTATGIAPTEVVPRATPQPATKQVSRTGLYVGVVAVGLVLVAGLFVLAGGDPGGTVTGPPARTDKATTPVEQPSLPESQDPIVPEVVQPVMPDQASVETPFWGAFFYANNTKSTVESMASQAEGLGFTTLVINTGDYSSIGTSGKRIWVACAGPYSTRAEATSAAKALKKAGLGNAYAKEVW